MAQILESKKFLAVCTQPCVVRCNAIQNDPGYGTQKKRDVRLVISSKCRPFLGFKNNKRFSKTVSRAIKAYLRSSEDVKL